MPELPEVETVARQLAPLLEAQRIVAAEILDAKLLPFETAALTGRRIARVERLGKQVVLRLEDPVGAAPVRWLAVHLRMTGRLVWSREPEPAGRAPRARLALERGHLLFLDVRRFGTWRLLDDPSCVAGAALDPMSRAFTPRALAECLAGSAQPIKPWLLRQDRLVGIGNIYACEALFESGIAPGRAAGGLCAEEVARLHAALRRVLRRAIRSGGTSFSDFQDAHGELGAYQKRLLVYGRAGQPCRVCGQALTRAVHGSRGTFFCGHCQR